MRLICGWSLFWPLWRTLHFVWLPLCSTSLICCCVEWLMQVLCLLSEEYQCCLGGPRENSITIYAQLPPHLFAACSQGKVPTLFWCPCEDGSHCTYNSYVIAFIQMWWEIFKCYSCWLDSTSGKRSVNYWGYQRGNKRTGTQSLRLLLLSWSFLILHWWFLHNMKYKMPERFFFIEGCDQNASLYAQ